MILGSSDLVNTIAFRRARGPDGAPIVIIYRKSVSCGVSGAVVSCRFFTL